MAEYLAFQDTLQVHSSNRTLHQLTETLTTLLLVVRILPKEEKALAMESIKITGNIPGHIGLRLLIQQYTMVLRSTGKHLAGTDTY